MSATVALNEPPVPHATLLLVGPAFMGALTSWMIFGISIVQLLYWVFILDIFLTVVAAAMGWHILFSGWGRTTNLVQPGWTFSAIGAGDGIIATTVQIFYAWRIWVLKRWLIVPGLIVLIALAQLGSTLSIAAGLIAVTMVYLLTMAKKNTRTLNGGERAINRLIRLSVETGCLTAASAIIELGFFLGPTTKNTNLHLFLYVLHPYHVPATQLYSLPLFPIAESALIFGKIYSNMMMTSLNSRTGTQQMATSRSTTDVTSRSIAFTPYFRTGTASIRADQTSPVIHITSRTEVFANGVGSTNCEDKETIQDDIEMMVRKPSVRLETFSSV
ncbi:hypothetical protein GSI_07943 [Ganoderma sinense ZZ0214-1]|uniref:DUF6534 domain-containing protein n=1 Tax=Ganoderma sinense ZZ0214-1 TaxID=1077348 RepID=A0A2G8S8E2_9APHY|nr:hypothetical protein GSI_07943 [Ganoderma sinense ZZ0214-1]